MRIVWLPSGGSRVCVCVLPLDTGNAKTNVEGQKYQIYSFYLVKEFSKKKKLLLGLVSFI